MSIDDGQFYIPKHYCDTQLAAKDAEIARLQGVVGEAGEIIADLLNHRLLPMWNDKQARAFLAANAPEQGGK